MKNAFALFAAVALTGQASFAADVFVRNAKMDGVDSSRMPSTSASQVTDHVKKAVRGMPEHSLVNSESQADFILAPTVTSRGEELVLRIQKEKDGQVMATSEEIIPSSAASITDATTVTQTALNEDTYATDENVSEGTSSAMTSGSDTTSMDVAGESNISSSPTSDMSQSSSRSSTTSMDDSSKSERGSVSGASGGGGVLGGLAARESEVESAPGGDVRAPSPRMANPNRLGTFMAGVGPAFPLGMNSDRLMYNVNAAYGINFNPTLTGKVFGDVNLATGGDTARFLNFGAAAEIFPFQSEVAGGIPYIQGDVGYAFTRRNETEEQEDGLALGAGAGFKFMAAQTNLDVNLHYTVLTSQVADTNPSILGVRLAVAF